MLKRGALLLPFLILMLNSCAPSSEHKRAKSIKGLQKSQHLEKESCKKHTTYFYLKDTITDVPITYKAKFCNKCSKVKLSKERK